MTPRQLHRLLLAPEILVVDLSLAVLVALDRALRLEHPLLDAPPSEDDPPPRRRARVALRHAARLRRALHSYRALVRCIVRRDVLTDLPF